MELSKQCALLWQDSTIYNCKGGMSSRNRQVCGGSTYAFVYPTDRNQNIYICDFTFDYPDYSGTLE